MQGNLLVITPVTVVPGTKTGLGSRGSVKEFSVSSGARMRRYLRTCVAEYSHMVTLTYPCGYTRDGAQSKEHLRRFIQEINRLAQKSFDRTTATKNKWSCFWFMEFQERGAIHYHLFTTCGYPKDIISRLWYGIVGSEDIRHLYAGTRIEHLRSGRRGTCSYASKYAAKSEQKTVPDDILNCGRFWGVSGYRIAMSADATIDPEARKCAAVQRAQKRVKTAVNDAIAAGECRKMTYGSSLVFWFSEDRSTYEVAAMMLRLEMAVNLYCSRLNITLPHHEDDEMEVPSVYTRIESDQPLRMGVK